MLNALTITQSMKKRVKEWGKKKQFIVTNSQLRACTMCAKLGVKTGHLQFLFDFLEVMSYLVILQAMSMGSYRDRIAILKSKVHKMSQKLYVSGTGVKML